MKVLLIRLREIGDVVFTTPAVRALRERFPEARIDYLVERVAAPVVAGNPHLSDVIISPRRPGAGQLAADLALARQLRRAGYDLVIDFHGGPRASWLAWATGASRRIGYDIPGRGWRYTTRVARPRALRPRHSVRNQWDLLEPLGIAPPDPSTFPLEMIESPTAAATIARRLSDARVDANHSIVVVHVSAGNPFRRWPSDAFTDLIARLASRDSRRRIILTAGPSDRDAATRILDAAEQRLATEDRDAIVRFGEIDLAEVRSLIGRAALYIGGDSGPLHIAATTTTPIVALFGPTLAERSAPWRNPALVTELVDMGSLPCRPCEQRRCVPGDFRCLTALPAERVATAAERAIERLQLARGAGGERGGAEPPSARAWGWGPTRS